VRLLLLSLLACGVLAARAEEVHVKLRAIPEAHEANPDSPFALGTQRSDLGRDRLQDEVELRAAVQGINLVATGRSTAMEGKSPDNELVVNELYYDTTLWGQRLGGGKKIMSWDVGFGFRPLDVIQQENRRAIFNSTLEGIPFVAWERFDETSAWTVLLANPGRGKAGSPRDDESVAAKAYFRKEQTDWHAVLRVSERHQWETGMALTQVSEEGLEWHGSFLFQRRYEKLLNRLAEEPGAPLSASDPMEARVHENGVKALLGMTWTGTSGISILAEAWYDKSAYTASEWTAVADLARRQSALLGVNGIPEAAVRGNVAYSLRYFEQPNLLQQNLLARVSWKGESGTMEPALDVLYTPGDHGWVATLSAGYEGNRYRIDTGYRVFGGPDDSAYRMLPERRVIYVAGQFAF
jgi:hypothetical protein